MSSVAVSSATEACAQTAKLELADVIGRYGPAYRRTHRMPLSHHNVFNAIEACRTPRMGGHVEWCQRCNYRQFVYHSCRNRHCPKCQTLAKAQWLENRQAELLPVPYFHNVFTLPHELNALVLANQRPMLKLLFQAVAKTLLEFGCNELGGKLGFTMVLHTWDQTLRAHFHVHCVIAGGALADDGHRWIASEPRFLFPVHALSKVFRGKFLDGLKNLYKDRQLRFVGRAESLRDPKAFQRLIDQLYAKSWVVYSKRPFGGPQQVFDYLGRYTHRVAISNHRLISMEDGQVRFTYRDRTDRNQRKIMCLKADEFLGRFLLHVLPPRFMRIRHCGFLANRNKKAALPACRQCLGQAVEVSKPPEKSAAQWLLQLTGVDVTRCPKCGHSPLNHQELPPVVGLSLVRSLPEPAVLDSS
jgi:hypothetical protein